MLSLFKNPKFLLALLGAVAVAGANYGLDAGVVTTVGTALISAITGFLVGKKPKVAEQAE